MNRGRSRILRAGSWLLVTALACSDEAAGPGSDDVTIAVIPGTLTLRAGESRRLDAVVMDASGAVLNPGVTWQSSAPHVVTVDDMGVARAHAPGQAVIRARVGSAVGEASVEVDPPEEALLPFEWRMETGQRVTFRAVVGGNVSWAVNGVAGGNGLVGTISTDGVYTAPPLVPASGSTTISATGAEGTASAVVTVLERQGGSPTLSHTSDEPRVFDAAEGGDLRSRITVLGQPDSVVLVADGLPRLPALAVAVGTWELVIPELHIRMAHSANAAHAFAGFIQIYAGTQVAVRANKFVNVLTPGMPPVSPTPIDAGAQAGPHVLNLRVDGFQPGQPVREEVIRRAYEILADEHDFIAVVEAADAPRNRNYMPVSNDTRGIGLPFFDEGQRWDSSGRLQGIIQYPILSLFDLAAPAAIHEIGHRWINFVDAGPLAEGIPHWPLSDIAFGIMGFSIGSLGGQGGTFPFDVVPIGDGDYRLEARETATAFNDVELYMMGLIPVDSVGEHFVFEDQSQVDRISTGILQGPVVTVNGASIVELAGPRDPHWRSSQRDFRIATVVLSEGRLLSPTELAFVDHMAARGSANTPLPYTSGFVSGFTLPFVLATGGRARLYTSLRLR
jgi:hypothetical protein